MREEFDKLYTTFEKVIDAKDETIERLKTQYEQDLNEMIDRWEKSENEKLDIMLDRRNQGSDSMPKVKDIRKIGESMMADLRSLAEAEESAVKKREFLQELIDEEDEEALKNLSLEELQKLETKNVREETGKKLREKADKLRNTYNEIVNNSKPDFSPSKDELERRKHAQAALQERLNGVEDPEKLTDIFDEIVQNEPKPKGKEAYDLIYNRLKNKEDPAAENRIEKLRRQHLLTDGELESLEQHETIKDAGYFVEMLPNNCLSTADDIHERGMDLESTQEYIENAIAPVLKKAVNEMKVDEGKSRRTGWEGSPVSANHG